jgi:hypothetical protein
VDDITVDVTLTVQGLQVLTGLSAYWRGSPAGQI